MTDPAELEEPRSSIFTIGHSNLAFDDFANALERFHIRTVIDVRSVPYSQYAPQYNRDVLGPELARRDIAYRFAGNFLGGRPTDTSLYRSIREDADRLDYLKLVDHDAVSRSEPFRRGLQRLRALADNEAIAIMCSEEDPNSCHRHHLIAQALVGSTRVLHIRTKGSGGPFVAEADVEPRQLSLV